MIIITDIGGLSLRSRVPSITHRYAEKNSFRACSRNNNRQSLQRQILCKD